MNYLLGYTFVRFSLLWKNIQDLIGLILTLFTNNEKIFLKYFDTLKKFNKLL